MTQFQRSVRPINTFSRPAFSRRRRGISLVLFALITPLIFFLLGMVIDLGNLYNVRARAQRAADAAALAGAVVSSTTDNSQVVPTAENYAALNDFPVSDPRVQVSVTPNYGANRLNRVRVVVRRDVEVYFAPISEALFNAFGFGTQAVMFSRRVSAEAVAEKLVPVSLNLGDNYGIADPNVSPANNSVFGPFANYNFGDPWSTQFLQNGDVNPRYTEKNGWHEFELKLSSNFRSDDGRVHVQIFDPDSYSKSGDKYDESRTANSRVTSKIPAGVEPNVTKTRYEVVAPNGTLLAEAEYGADPTTDEKWVTPPGFNIPVTPGSSGPFKIRVKALEGASENGFKLRAGPSQGLGLTDLEWNAQFGDKRGTNPDNVVAPITASEKLQMNFTRNGTVNFKLGYVNPTGPGQQVSFTKFDVDVGSRSIVYTCDTLPNQEFLGVLPSPGDGRWSTDTFTLPDDYKGGMWSARYVAGAGDTSSWEIASNGGGPGYVRLTQ